MSANDPVEARCKWRPASTKLPPEKFDPKQDQTGAGKSSIPLLCQEACNLLVAECRKIVTSRSATPSRA